MSFLLLASPSTYANREYIVEASPFFCAPRNDYRIRWRMPQLADVAQPFARIPGHVLRIPAGRLKVHETYRIDATLVRANDSQVIVYVRLEQKIGFSYTNII